MCIILVLSGFVLPAQSKRVFADLSVAVPDFWNLFPGKSWWVTTNGVSYRFSSDNTTSGTSPYGVTLWETPIDGYDELELEIDPSISPFVSSGNFNIALINRNATGAAQYIKQDAFSVTFGQRLYDVDFTTLTTAQKQSVTDILLYTNDGTATTLYIRKVSLY